MTKILYFHGFQGSSQSKTALALKEVFGNEILCLSYDFLNPINAAKQIEEALWPLIEAHQNVVAAGTSLGGMWANYAAENWKLKAAILINPSLQSQETLPVYLGEVEGLTQELIDAYAAFPMKETAQIYKIVLSGARDTVIPTQIVKRFFPTREVRVLDEGHRIEDVSPILAAIKEAVNTFS